MPGKPNRVDPYYERDGIVIHHGDNIEVMSQMPSDSIDLVVTSPPYDNLRTYGGHSWGFEGVANQLWRLVKPGGVVVWIVADATIDGSETGTSFRQALHFMDIGFRLHDTMIYERGATGGAKGSNYSYWQSWEFMFIFSKGRPVTLNLIRDRQNTYGGKKSGSMSQRKPNGELTNRPPQAIATFGIRTNVWKIKTGKGHTADVINHPAMFPEALARDHILSWSNEGDTVLDPFNGSGTTTKMAKLMGRKCIGIDVNAEYCEIAANRLKQNLLSFGE